ncbi:TPA: helix-turn-helix domain-containing protein [Photobacterium damselae]
MDKNNYHHKIKNARLKSRISQSEMSRLLNISRQTYIDIENGIRTPRADTIHKIAIVTNTSISYFYYDTYDFGDVDQIAFLIEQLPNEKKLWYINVLKKIIEYENSQK